MDNTGLANSLTWLIPLFDGPEVGDGVAITNLNLRSEEDTENGILFTSTVTELDSKESKINGTLSFDAVTGLDEAIVFCRDHNQEVLQNCTLFVLRK